MKLRGRCWAGACWSLCVEGVDSICGGCAAEYVVVVSFKVSRIPLRGYVLLKFNGEWAWPLWTVLLKLIGVVNVLLKFKCVKEAVLPRLTPPLPLFSDFIDGTYDGWIARFCNPVPCPNPYDVMLPPVPLIPRDVWLIALFIKKCCVWLKRLLEW